MRRFCSLAQRQAGPNAAADTAVVVAVDEAVAADAVATVVAVDAAAIAVVTAGATARFPSADSL